MSYLDQKVAEQRYAADRAAEAARRDYEAAKAAQMAKVMNQGNPAGLASRMADPYVSGISAEDAYKLKLAQDAQKANEYRVIQDMISKNRTDLAEVQAAKGMGYDNSNPYSDPSNPITKSVDQGLAAKWLADRGSFK